jgi:hypothetical protein
MSGGLAVAETLGRFGSEGLTSAYYWTSPAPRSPSFWAFRAFRNFDGHGGRFLDRSVATTSNVPLSSIFGSRDADGTHAVAVLLNFATLSSISSRIAVQNCGTISNARAFTYSGGETGLKPFDVTAAPTEVQATVPPYSITVLDLSLSHPPR